MTPDSPLLLTFTILLLAHLLGDFVLQPGKWVREKEKRSWKSRYFYWHILLHGLLSFLLIANLAFWPWALLLTLLHGLTDLLKIKAQKNTSRSKRRWFWMDQGLHLIVLILLTVCWTGQLSGDNRRIAVQALDGCRQLLNAQNLLLLTAIVFLTSPCAIFIKTMISGWTPTYNNTLETDSLHNAGKYIGMLERMFVFAFFISGYPEGIGFLLAAKSIFRFGDLKAARDRKLTEYVLIGTLLSFGFALLAAMIYKALHLAYGWA